MNIRHAVSALCFVAFSAALIIGCGNKEDPFTPIAPETATQTGDEHIMGVWHLAGSDEGFQFSPGGVLLRLTVDQQNRLQVSPDDGPGQWVVPQTGHCVISWVTLTGLSQSQVNTRVDSYQFTYVTSDNDSTLMLTWVDSSGVAVSGTVNIYKRKTIGDVVK
jgi:hypothetical protein